ncbi:hypothetical protein AVEN_3464-1 [Araneus ventricosus]|uniref:Uncharacterized protein n=1 Tax=Araneus ventricosus TaxID=182803 RepID=A0A4Y2T3D4_ARAVE|nr:hypothetical protein AVEN_3464-1 [Araneus ventricosus]
MTVKMSKLTSSKTLEGQNIQDVRENHRINIHGLSEECNVSYSSFQSILTAHLAHPNRHYISPQMATEEHLRHDATGVPRNGRDEQKKLPPFVENNNPDIDGNPFYKAPIRRGRPVSWSPSIPVG